MGNPFIKNYIPNQATLEGHIVKGLESVRSNVRPNSKFYASDAGICPVRNVRSATDVSSEVFSATSTMYTTIGTEIHNQISKSLDKEGLLIFDEYKLPDVGLKVGAKVDDIIIWQNKIYGLEIKSCGELPGSIKPEHKAQATLYSFITGLPFIVVYLSRNVADRHGDLKIKTFYLEKDEAYTKTVVGNLIVSSLSLDAGKLPPIPFTFERHKNPCAMCKFNFACYSKIYPNGLDEMGSQEYLDILEKSDEIFDELSNGIKQRRNGILKHIQANTDKENVKEILSGEWENLLN